MARKNKQTDESNPSGARSDLVHTSCRVSQATLDRIDVLKDVIQKKQEDTVTRADVFRMLVADELPRYEAALFHEAPPKIPRDS